MVAPAAPPTASPVAAPLCSSSVAQLKEPIKNVVIVME